MAWESPEQSGAGRLVNHPGQFTAGAGPASPASFLKITRLVR